MSNTRKPSDPINIPGSTPVIISPVKSSKSPYVGTYGSPNTFLLFNGLQTNSKSAKEMAVNKQDNLQQFLSDETVFSRTLKSS